ncbi:pseudouridylate synthase 1 homolog [Hylaeus volcanicus]|uniref:pseudouridylate synthase 1 homolog n=1 Tax=Hylaeus volcanicus TaxID=313075 RepID=UPI0023B86584|nr:pseudouridylate synthase 1 homolog [Hylaeus volcanicus]XP_053980211.1 pseudouridylate synthase 1 homolog [Hylaeus volcanicus]XP_053980298.1 pseudouridylate synthase 1 homolog [Hylaeus volcanicus]XP_053980378.1 pseudouridylate synthase 1 homolog [Hylaeus volcanicus]XP_053980462.1 pseudouridylate synthase 1 homolog [Hylaeus volcanicus]
MYSCQKVFFRNNTPFFRSWSAQFDKVCNRIMSVQTDIIDQDAQTLLNANKRPIADSHDEVEVDVKVQKTEESTDVTQRVKRKNFVLMMGYLGRDYFGMQRNPGTKTIEEDLLLALFKSNLITKDQFDDIREVRFQRAARTDRGVSAVRQIVSLRLPNHANKDEINKYLPEEIRVFAVRRVTKGFNSKNQCDARTYRYVMPTFVLASESPNFLQVNEGDVVDPEKRLEELLMIDGKPYNEFRLTTNMLNKLNETLKLLEGTHNFHNFTSKIKPLDPRARRYIIYFRCVETFVANDIEFAVLEVKGQSFMLHQIRKMVALIVGISRNIITNDMIKDMFSLDRFDIPIAPSLGLSLHHVHYTYYNERYGSDGIHETLAWEDCDEEIEQFYKDYILKSIVDIESSEKTCLKWLASFLTPQRFACKDPSAS